MRAIVYDIETGEPITAINLKREWLAYLESQRRVEFVIRNPVALRPVSDEAPIYEPLQTVELSLATGVTPTGQEFPILFTDQSTLALKLDPVLLAGQNQLLQDAFEQGMAQALQFLAR